MYDKLFGKRFNVDFERCFLQVAAGCFYKTIKLQLSAHFLLVSLAKLPSFYNMINDGSSHSFESGKPNRLPFTIQN